VPEEDSPHSGIRRYLLQQKKLFGETLVFDHAIPDLRSARRPSAASPHEPTEQPDMKRQSAKSISDAWVTSTTLDEMYAHVSGCLQCPLGSTRNKFVFGVGNPKADIVLIGEAPGADEDKQGEPFVGRAGQLLNKILQAINIEREEVYICNILKCRPPNNRDPLASETAQCEPYLHHQLRIIQPKIILALGRIAGQTLLKTNATLGVLRSNVQEYQGIPMMVTYHPAALLRNPDWKIPTWEDIKKFRALYDELCSKTR
jgi:DNA polymerase